MATISTDANGLLGLLQLASPSLPIGGFSYSQALEAAIAAGNVTDETSAQSWMLAGLTVQAQCDAALVVLSQRAWQAADLRELRRINEFAMATRESAELRLECEQMGASLARWVRELDLGSSLSRAQLRELAPLSLPVAYGYVAHHLRIVEASTVLGWLFSWLENQVAVVVKAVPLGQSAGQRLLLGLRESVTLAAGQALDLALDDIHSCSPMLAVLSARHETQYCRLFRS